MAGKKAAVLGDDVVGDYARAVIAGKIVAGPHVRATCRRHLADLKEGKQRGIVWSWPHANRALSFFREVLVLSDGQFDGQPFKLEPSQTFIVGSLFGWLRDDGTRRFRRAYIEQGKGNGKALALDTPIPTPSGWTTMGALESGDQVLGADGKPCVVIMAHPVETDRGCFEVEFDDGAKIVASAEHLWRTEHRRPKPGGTTIKTTREIAESLRYSNGQYQSANHSVALSAPLDLPEADLPVPPYVLGAWLGDGDSDCARLTSPFTDRQIVEEIVACGQPVREQIRHSDTTGRFGLNAGRGRRGDTLTERLRQIGVLGNKHIPVAYLRGSRRQRLGLLQGLMDTDGCISAKGACEFTSVKAALADGVLELIRSLGIKATMAEGRAKLYGRDVGPKYRIHFHPHWNVPIFRLQRKAARHVQSHGRRRLSADRRIIGCRPVDPVAVRCITVDSSDSMFLCGREMVPTHNSPLAGGVGLYGMMADREPGAQVFAIAAKMDQARILFNDAVTMVRQSPELTSRITPTGINPVNNLADLTTGSFFRPVGRDTGKTGSGLRPHFVLVDELHEHPNREAIEMMERGFKFRRQPLILMITNSGQSRTSICFEEHEHAVKVAHGDVEDDNTFSYVCALDEGDDPLTDPSCWIKANPLLGVTLRETYLADVAAQALAIPGKANSIRRLHFCQWVDSESAWIGRDVWEACEDPTMTLDQFMGKRCWLGLDLGATKDMTGLATVFADGMDDEGRPKFALFAHGYTPKETLAERTVKDRAPYDAWVADGHLTATPGKVIRLDHVAADVVADSQRFEIEAVAFDRWLIRGFDTALDELGVTLPLIEHPQGTNRRKDSPLWMPESITQFETLLLERRLRIAVNPALRSAISGATFWTSPAGLRRFEKQRATTRIDLALAATMAIGAAMDSTDPAPPSVYETRGILTI